MKKDGERRSIFKKGKGRAFLKFLLGELTLIAVVSVIYLFIVQGDVSSLLPKPTAPQITATPVPTATPAPTMAITLPPTLPPTPAPTATPVPFEMISLPAGEDAPEAPVMPDGRLKLGMSECRAFKEAGQNVLIISGHAYIEGLDASKTDIYLLVMEAESASVVGMYPAESTPENAYLSFDASSGSNLENAFFTCRIDVSEYESSSYMLSAVAVNEDTVKMNYFDNLIFHFRVENGKLVIEE